MISTFNSLNEIVDLDELTAVFRNVFRSLHPGGRFLFEMTLDEGFQARWHGSFGMVEDDRVCVIRPTYHPDQRLGRNEITLFYLNDGWHRADLLIVQRGYLETEVRSALENVGFSETEAYDVEGDFGRKDERGRTFFVCSKPQSSRELE